MIRDRNLFELDVLRRLRRTAQHRLNQDRDPICLARSINHWLPLRLLRAGWRAEADRCGVRLRFGRRVEILTDRMSRGVELRSSIDTARGTACRRAAYGIGMLDHLPAGA